MVSVSLPSLTLLLLLTPHQLTHSLPFSPLWTRCIHRRGFSSPASHQTSKAVRRWANKLLFQRLCHGPRWSCGKSLGSGLHLLLRIKMSLVCKSFFPNWDVCNLIESIIWFKLLIIVLACSFLVHWVVSLIYFMVIAVAVWGCSERMQMHWWCENLCQSVTCSLGAQSCPCVSWREPESPVSLASLCNGCHTMKPAARVDKITALNGTECMNRNTLISGKLEEAFVAY